MRDRTRWESGRHRGAGSRRLGAVVLGVSLVFCGGVVTDAEVRCEEAAARLERCCPGFDSAGMSCFESIGGFYSCGAPTPDLDLPESSCVLGKGCDALRADGTCARAAYLYAGGPDPGGNASEVCP